MQMQKKPTPIEIHKEVSLLTGLILNRQNPMPCMKL
jgi:hypothetical protein